MHLFHNHHHDLNGSYLHLFRLHGMWGMYLNQLFRRISSTMIGLFIPIYLYENLGSYDYLFLYYLMIHSWSLVWISVVASVMRSWGSDFALILGSVFRAVCVFLMPLIQIDPRWIFVVALFNGMTLAFDWFPYHYSVASLSLRKKDFGKSSSYISIMEKLAGAIGPVVGALVITYLNYNWLYFFSAAVLFLAAFAPLFDSFNNKKMHFNWSEIFQRFKDPGILKHVVAHGFHVFDINAYVIIWPLILIGGFGTVMKTGIFQSTTLVLSTFILFWLSKHLDKGNYWVMKIGSAFSSLHWLMRYMFGSPFGLAVSEIFYSLGQVMLWTPFISIVYEKGSKGYKMEFFFVRQVLRMVLGILVVMLLWVVFKLVNSISVMLLVFSGIMLGTAFITKLFVNSNNNS